MNIYYIHHSCYIVETDNEYLIFDYFKAKNKLKSDFNFDELLNRIITSHKNLYVFVSHSHQDHFNPEVFDWGTLKKNTYYILSDDIKIYKQVKNHYVVKENQEFNINNLKINTFGSTDEGVSFLIDSNSKTIFHAGDLNWWKWPDDTKEEEKFMETSFKKIVENIIQLNTKIDIAFFPVDKRLEENYYVGGQYFIEKLKPILFFPIHFWNDFKTTNQFKTLIYKLNFETKVIEIKNNNQIIKI